MAASDRLRVPTRRPSVHREVVVAETPAARLPRSAGSDDLTPPQRRSWRSVARRPDHPIVVKAAELGHDPVAIYRLRPQRDPRRALIRIAQEPVGGARSRATGNDADQALLLAELLRAAGYPARLAQGVVEFPTDRLMSHFAVTDPRALEDLLTAMGDGLEPRRRRCRTCGLPGRTVLVRGLDPLRQLPRHRTRRLRRDLGGARSRVRGTRSPRASDGSSMRWVLMRRRSSTTISPGTLRPNLDRTRRMSRTAGDRLVRSINI